MGLGLAALLSPRGKVGENTSSPGMEDRRETIPVRIEM